MLAQDNHNVKQKFSTRMKKKLAAPELSCCGAA